MSAPTETRIEVELPEGPAQRLDKALAQADTGLSRSRMTNLIKDGKVSGADGVPLTDPKTKIRGGSFVIVVPEASDGEPQAQDIPLDVVFEDAHLIVVNKPVGMVVHPAPGSPDGTLVNALLHHCADSLSGIGGEKRPGIVHRIDKDTTGLLVVAKDDAAHQGLSAQFQDHSITRRYNAICWGAPDRADPRLKGVPGVRFEPGNVTRIGTNIDRHKYDRKKMAVTEMAGRHAVTRARIIDSFGPAQKPVCALVECWLETGRTHQIRVHMTHIGHALVGDPVYGSARAVPKGALPDGAQDALRGFGRQALHAAHLGFEHPVTGELLSFDAPLPGDMLQLLTKLRG